MRGFWLIILTVFIISCAPRRNEILGEWEVQSVKFEQTSREYIPKEEIEAFEKYLEGRIFEFRDNDRFVMRFNVDATDYIAGKWEYDGQHSHLVLHAGGYGSKFGRSFIVSEVDDDKMVLTEHFPKEGKLIIKLKKL